nr:MAG TPA: hypothetical protein [Caudoviricetes sp.]
MRRVATLQPMRQAKNKKYRKVLTWQKKSML